MTFCKRINGDFTARTTKQRRTGFLQSKQIVRVFDNPTKRNSDGYTLENHIPVTLPGDQRLKKRLKKEDGSNQEHAQHDTKQNPTRDLCKENPSHPALSSVQHHPPIYEDRRTQANSGWFVGGSEVTPFWADSWAGDSVTMSAGGVGRRGGLTVKRAARRSWESVTHASSLRDSQFYSCRSPHPEGPGADERCACGAGLGRRADQAEDAPFAIP